uniref:Putative secreted protein n=1 Tax=Anopheles darlingi TaxID=43151 RepID=A0A2M4DNN6_ANODA
MVSHGSVFLWLVCCCLLSSALRWEIILVQLDPSISTTRRASPFLFNFYQLRSLSLYQDTQADMHHPLPTCPPPLSICLSVLSLQNRDKKFDAIIS